MVAREHIQRVLIVEDIEPVRRALCKAIGVLLPSAVLTTASDGHEADLKLQGAEAEGHPFDLCVADYNLPHLTGLDVVKRARSASAASTAFILTSGRFTPGLVEEAASLNIPLLDKPFTMEAFAQELERLS
jgi:CheY-like chemotaxis protein